MSGLLLEIVEGPGTGDRLPLDDALELGREPSLPHALGDTKVSRHHARVVATGSGVSVEDLGSTNGTFLNDSPLEIATPIRPGDRIRVGFTVLELREASGQAPAAPAPPPLPVVGSGVLAPVPSRELPELAPPPEPEYGAVRVPSSQPRYVNTRVAQRIDELSPPRRGAPPPPPAPRAPAPAPRTPAPRSTGDPADEQNYRAISHLIDSRVKSRTNTAAFALLAIAALAVMIYFGGR